MTETVTVNLPTHQEELLAFSLAKSLMLLSYHEPHGGDPEIDVRLNLWDQAEAILPGIGHVDTREMDPANVPFVSHIKHDVLAQQGNYYIVQSGGAHLEIKYANGQLASYKYIATPKGK